MSGMPVEVVPHNVLGSGILQPPSWLRPVYFSRAFVRQQAFRKGCLLTRSQPLQPHPVRAVSDASGGGSILAVRKPGAEPLRVAVFSAQPYATAFLKPYLDASFPGSTFIEVKRASVTGSGCKQRLLYIAARA